MNKPQGGIDELIERYEALLFDAYGVLVHDTGALPGAAALTRHLHTIGKPFFVLSNDSSRLPHTAGKRYRGFGLQVNDEQLITSGSLLRLYFERHDLYGARCVVLGTADSKRYVEIAGGEVVGPAEAFDMIVVSDDDGYPFRETMNTTFSNLARAIDEERTIHLLLPNPDLIYPRAGGNFGFAAGSIAHMMEVALSARYPNRTDLRFVPLGKPEAGLFEEARRRTGTMNMVMFGDQPMTDIAGARAFGLDAVLVGSGVAPSHDTGCLPSAVPFEPTWYLPSVSRVKHSGA
ncbi:MAG: HAD hydrolase-like protein [Gammaproteobacteria bacterium]|nr:HAD hydrolase-like protein [Gammaproteobacteria bacterium]